MRRKRLNPLFLGGIIIGGFFLVNRIVAAKGQSAIPAITSASGKIVIPPNKRWRVRLRSGQQVQMSSAQLQNAIEAKAVKTYSLIQQTA